MLATVASRNEVFSSFSITAVGGRLRTLVFQFGQARYLNYLLLYT